MIAPTIHLNGTSRDAMLTQVYRAAHAVSAAIDALAAAIPKRDYYPRQGPESFSRAMQEFGNRIGRLMAVRDELNAIAEAISGQGNGEG